MRIRVFKNGFIALLPFLYVTGMFKSMHLGLVIQTRMKTSIDTQKEGEKIEIESEKER